MSSVGKLQTSNFKLQGSSKSQIPNPKKIPTSKSQKDPTTGFEIWSLRFVIFLGFGIWDLGFKTWCFSGAWSLMFGAFLMVANPANAAETSPSITNSHWSLQPISRPKVSPVANPRWKPRNPVDNFIFAKLAEAKLSPSPEAPRRTLIRRLYFDLIGLPPSPAEVRAFERDTAPDAYEKIVERLLASPRYGERWARHWLDVVRFAETHGFEMNQPRPNAWPYRDYVIRALNEDKPYDRFMLEQIAGDLFGEEAATGFLVGGAWDQVKSPDPVLTASQRADELHDMVSTTGSAFLGLTVGCARCHNHKFDPIPQTDYYAIKACLTGVQHGEHKLPSPDLAPREQAADASRRQLATVEARLAQFEPIAFNGRVLLLDAEPAETNAFGARVVEVVKRTTRGVYPAGASRGERDDAGDLTRLPNFSPSYLAWSNSVNKEVFAWEPRVEGQFHLWLSWGCGWNTHAKDARYRLDRDGNLSTTDDQKEIARVDQQHFADGTGDVPNKPLWSGFYAAGVCELTSSSKILLRGGTNDGYVTASVLALVEQPPIRSPGAPASVPASAQSGRLAGTAVAAPRASYTTPHSPSSPSAALPPPPAEMSSTSRRSRPNVCGSPLRARRMPSHALTSSKSIPPNLSPETSPWPAPEPNQPRPVCSPTPTFTGSNTSTTARPATAIAGFPTNAAKAGLSWSSRRRCLSTASSGAGTASSSSRTVWRSTIGLKWQPARTIGAWSPLRRT